jgi:hypothetical protein
MHNGIFMRSHMKKQSDAYQAQGAEEKRKQTYSYYRQGVMSGGYSNQLRLKQAA